MAAGDFTASQLVLIKLKAEQMWTTGQFAADLKPHAEAAQAVLKNQVVKITPLTDPEKDNQVAVTWLYGCGITDQAKVEECDLTAPELESKTKSYTLDLSREAEFSIDREKIRTDNYSREEQVAQGMARAVKALDEYWAKQVLIKLKSFAGVNVSPDPGTYSSVTNTTTIPAANYNRTLVPYLIKSQILNRMDDAYYISNGDLYIDWANARLDAGNANGKGDLARIEQLTDFTYDLWNFVKAALTEDLFMVGRGAVAMSVKNRFTAAPQVMGGKVNQTWFTTPSIAFPGISYDVTYEMQCKVTGGKKRILDVFKAETLGGVFLNPEGCPVTIDVAGTPTAFNPTGVLSFSKGS